MGNLTSICTVNVCKNHRSKGGNFFDIIFSRIFIIEYCDIYDQLFAKYLNLQIRGFLLSDLTQHVKKKKKSSVNCKRSLFAEVGQLLSVLFVLSDLTQNVKMCFSSSLFAEVGHILSVI